MTRKERFEELGSGLGALVGEKDEHYGEMMNSTKLFLKSIFPDGIGTTQYGTVGLLVRVFDKLRRSTHDGHDNAEDWRDIAGYGLQGLAHYTAESESEPEDALRAEAEWQRHDVCGKNMPFTSCPLYKQAGCNGCRKWVSDNPAQAIELMRKGVD